MVVLVEVHAGLEMLDRRDPRGGIGRGHDHVGEVEHLGAVLFGDAHDVADDVHRELEGDVAHEVAGALRRGGIEDLRRARRDLLVEPADHAAA